MEVQEQDKIITPSYGSQNGMETKHIANHFIMEIMLQPYKTV